MNIAPLAAPIILLLAVMPGWAADHYVRAGATGNGGGSDWTNACTDFTGSCAVSNLVRGHTYYVAAGTYGSRTFNTAENGTLVINILRATNAAHGTDTGWLPAYDGQVAWLISSSGWRWGVAFVTSYWVFDGVTGSGFGVVNYGFKIAPTPADCSTAPNKVQGVVVGNEGSQTNNVTLKHIGMQGCGPSYNINSVAFGLGCGACFLNNITVSNNYSIGNTDFFGITNMSNSTMDHNIGERFDVYPGIHAEVVAATSYSVGAGGLCTANKCTTNDTFSNNIIKNCRASGCIQTILSGGDPIPIDSWRIFGNVFVDDQSGDGTITPGGPSGISNTLVYNNTGVNIHRFFEECANFTSCALSNGNVVKNNLLYKSDSRINAKSDVGTGTGGPIDHDYNTFWNPIDAGLSEPNGQIVIGSPCPLQNCAIDNTGNYHLLQGGGTGTNQVNAGLALSSTYSLDPDGNIRGADGVWDRGAYEFADAFPGANPPPARPKGVRLP